MYPIILKPYVSETIWGGRKLIDEYHVVTDKKNAAEGWMLSCHPAGESTVVNGEFAGQTLTEVLKRDPALCGSNAERFEDFPILIKLSTPATISRCRFTRQRSIASLRAGVRARPSAGIS